MHTIKDLQALDRRDSSMPMLFIGHGSPMNGIEDNAFSASWEKLGKTIPTPSAVLCISAHWFTAGTHITAMEKPPTIHDFYGFPKALFDVQYPAPGSPALARETASLVRKTEVGLDHEWGLDHGTWTIIRHMYPAANIPVLQLSMDYTKGPRYHYELAQELAALRQKGVLVVGSGNLVHNLGMLNWKQPDGGFDWAVSANEKFKHLITQRDHQALMQYPSLGQDVKLAVPTPEHFLPLLYILGLQREQDQVSFFNDQTTMGSISMTSLLVQDR